MADPDERGRGDPVRGWRYWQLSPATGQLRSVTQRRIDWPPRRGLRARCTGAGHRAPDASCDCGIYGARDVDTLREHGLCLAPEILVVGEVSLWGRVIDDEDIGPSGPVRGPRGWRGEFAYPARLWVVEGMGDDTDPPALAEQLGAAYGVPFGTIALADAVAGASAAMLTFQAMSARASRSSPSGA